MRRHDLDPVSLTFGLIFLGLAGAWLAVESDATGVDGLRWFFPVLLLTAGAAGTLSSLLRDRGRPTPAPSNADPDEPAEASAEDPDVVDTPGRQS